MAAMSLELRGNERISRTDGSDSQIVALCVS